MALAVAGCGGDDDSDAAPATTAAAGETTLASPRCEPAASDLTTPLGNGISAEGARLTNAYVVKSEDHDSIYFVSAEIDGTGYEDAGDIATWASTSRFGGDLVYAVDDLANELSTLRDGREVAGVSLDDDGVDESRACAGG